MTPAASTILAAGILASQIVVAPLDAEQPHARSAAAAINARSTAGKIVIGGDQRIVGGWHTFGLGDWLAFTATNWRDFAARTSVGNRAGRTSASQIVAEERTPDAAPLGRAAASQIVVEQIAAVSRHGVMRSQIITEQPTVAHNAGRVTASQLITH